MIDIGVLKESVAGENRVALTPSNAEKLVKAGHRVLVELNAGLSAGFPDVAYTESGCELRSRFEVVTGARVLAAVNTPNVGPQPNPLLENLTEAHTVIGFADPFSTESAVNVYAGTGASLFAIELMPRITRAQSMDALSSMATVSGYKIVLSVADRLPRMFPLMMTAAGTVSPARILILGAGVAGLQAIATARRLGAVVSAYDVRPVVKEQVESLGATFVTLEIEAAEAEDSGGYATDQGKAFYEKQQAALAAVVAEHHVVITTALIPGRQAPILLTESMVRGMAPGSIVADMAAERGGNCALTVPGEEVDVDGVRILGPTNIPSMVPYHASQMYSRNLVTFLEHLTGEDGDLIVDESDEITKDTLVTWAGDVVNERVKEAWSSAS